MGLIRYSDHFATLFSDQTLSQRLDLDVEIAFGQKIASQNGPNSVSGPTGGYKIMTFRSDLDEIWTKPENSVTGGYALTFHR